MGAWNCRPPSHPPGFRSRQLLSFGCGTKDRRPRR
jgi:hypothetical protein